MQHATETIKVLVTDDHAISRAGLAGVLEAESDMTVVGEAIDGQDAIQKTGELHPDVIILDVLMPRLDGMGALAYIKRHYPESKVLMLTISDREEHLLQALKFGAHGYLSKEASIPEIVQAVRDVANSKMTFPPLVATKLVTDLREHSNPPEISQREQQVMELLGEGMTNSQIAEHLLINESTVRTYLHRLISKLQLKNRTELTAYAIHHHLFEADSRENGSS